MECLLGRDSCWSRQDPDDDLDLFLVALDVEGTLTPEAWLALQQKTGLEELKLTTAHEPDYDKLMKYRIDVLRKNNVKLEDMRQVVKDLPPLPGAVEFLEWLRPIVPRILLLTDTFEEYAMPMFEKLGYPCVFCNSLQVDSDGTITGHTLRLKDQKRKAVEAFQRLNFRVIACGDSFNDISMMKAAERAILFQPNQKVMDAHPDIPVVQSHAELKTRIGRILAANRKVLPRQLADPCSIASMDRSRSPWLIIINIAGTLGPEPWTALAADMGIKDLRVTTAERPDYELMMQQRAAVLRQNNIKLQQMFKVVERLEPLDGAKKFLQWLKATVPRAFLVTDIFEEYAQAMCEKLGHPMVFCNFLEADKEGFLARNVVRMRSPAGWGSTSSYQKTKCVEEFQRLNFRIIAVGASFNDIGMLKAAEAGMFFKPPAKLSQAHPEIPGVRGYDDLKKRITEIIGQEEMKRSSSFYAVK